MPIGLSLTASKSPGFQLLSNSAGSARSRHLFRSCAAAGTWKDPSERNHQGPLSSGFDHPEPCGRRHAMSAQNPEDWPACVRAPPEYGASRGGGRAVRGRCTLRGTVRRSDRGPRPDTTRAGGTHRDEDASARSGGEGGHRGGPARVLDRDLLLALTRRDRAWRQNAYHLQAKELAKTRWFDAYVTRIARVARLLMRGLSPPGEAY